MSFELRPRNRRLRRPLARRCYRRTVRPVEPGPRVNHLAQALTAFNRAVRARFRLMRLAPEIFDEAVVRRQAEEREARHQQMAELEPALQKVYGPANDPAPGKLPQAPKDGWCRNSAEIVQFSPRKILKIESLLVERETWMAAGQHALECHRTLQPHRRISLSTVARLLDLSSKLGRLAVGMELGLKAKKLPADDFSPWPMHRDEALQRVYGGNATAKPAPAPIQLELG